MREGTFAGDRGGGRARPTDDGAKALAIGLDLALNVREAVLGADVSVQLLGAFGRVVELGSAHRVDRHARCGHCAQARVHVRRVNLEGCDAAGAQHERAREHGSLGAAQSDGGLDDIHRQASTVFFVLGGFRELEAA